jgi:hypothetical protein
VYICGQHGPHVTGGRRVLQVVMKFAWQQLICLLALGRFPQSSAFLVVGAPNTPRATDLTALSRAAQGISFCKEKESMVFMCWNQKIGLRYLESCPTIS